MKVSARAASARPGLIVAILVLLGSGPILSAQPSAAVPGPEAGPAAVDTKAVASDTGAAPSYETVLAESSAAGRAPPSPIAYRLVLRYCDPSVLEAPGLFEELVGSADRALRFGATLQETGLRVRREIRLATRNRQDPLAEGMMRLLHEEERRALFTGSPFAGPERGAGRLGGSLGNFSWSLGGGGDIGLGAFGGGGGAAVLPIGGATGGGKGQ